MPRQLPICIKTLADIRRQECYYVDKTAKILDLIDNGKCYFLSRPRRFGKSLLVDTIKELFEGNEALFEGLHAHGHWDWRNRHPVVRLDLSGSFQTRTELEENLLKQFADIAEEAGIVADAKTAAVGLRRLIRGLRRHAGQRVVCAGRRVRQANPGCSANAGDRVRQPRFLVRRLLDHQGLRRAYRVRPADGRQPVLDREHLLGDSTT